MKRFAFIAVLALAATAFVASPALAKHPPGYEKQTLVKHDASKFEISTVAYEAVAVAYLKHTPVVQECIAQDVITADATVNAINLLPPSRWLTVRYGDEPEQRPSSYNNLFDQPPYCSDDKNAKEYSEIGNSKAYMREK